MTIRELMERYRELLAQDPEAAERFVKEHENYELFVDLVDFRRDLIVAVLRAFGS